MTSSSATFRDFVYEYRSRPRSEDLELGFYFIRTLMGCNFSKSSLTCKHLRTATSDLKPTLDSTTMSTDSKFAVGSALKPLFHFIWTSMSQFSLQIPRHVNIADWIIGPRTHLRFHSMTKSPPSYYELRRFFASRPCEIPIDECDAVAYSYNVSHRIGSGVWTVVILRPARTRGKKRGEDHQCKLELPEMMETLSFLCGR